jgi:hypothetical protein
MRMLFGVAPFRRKLSAAGGPKGARFQPGLNRVCRPINGAIVERSDDASCLLRRASLRLMARKLYQSRKLYQ